MHLRAQPPIFVPVEYRAQLEAMSKAALMDLVWDFATTASASADDDDVIMMTLRERAEIIVEHRRQAKG